LRAIFHQRWRARALAGDTEAIDALARAALEPLYRFCFYRVGRNRHLCEEVVQETLCRAIRELDKYDPDRARDDVFPWLVGLARNEIQRALAKEKAAAALQNAWAKMDAELLNLYSRLESEPLSDEVLRRDQTRQMVNATMSQLPSHYREALEAKYVAGRSVRQMASAWSMSEKAVESQLTRARKAFRATFLALAGNVGFEPRV
jgi:RNA polymerase sigma-70 factor (ECF subfamily)